VRNTAKKYEFLKHQHSRITLKSSPEGEDLDGGAFDLLPQHVPMQDKEIRLLHAIQIHNTQ
jgi:hypothetical protein